MGKEIIKTEKKSTNNFNFFLNLSTKKLQFIYNLKIGKINKNYQRPINERHSVHSRDKQKKNKKYLTYER